MHAGDPNEQRDIMAMAATMRRNAEILKGTDTLTAHGYTVFARTLDGCTVFGTAIARADALFRRASILVQRVDDALFRTQIAEQRERLTVQSEQWSGVCHVCARMLPILRAMRSQRIPMQTR